VALAAESPVEADIVMPVPDTGAPAAAGFAEGSGLPYREGMVRNRYSGRTFIQPSQAMRQRGVTVKLSPLREVVAGKRLIVVDDSIVRGTTTRQIVALLRKAGATEVHLRISSPPIHHPCFYGIDTQIETELIASTHSVDEIREFVGADSLSYLSIGGFCRAWTCRTRSSASPASTGATRCRSRMTRPGTSSFWRMWSQAGLLWRAGLAGRIRGDRGNVRGNAHGGNSR